ncbi:oligosaccharide flippase family protein [Macrococcoides canis]|uniref:oligosaccharide flippase family protein n=1 Tax=Macrococcoides canis TaxID=1855823 RepID=UPI001AEBF438|nr:oligosaccharide flippase family protein [Macrococcus canis]QTQ08958.1 oligosaccharide flippase family protein [Macrococcus canis]
MKKNTLLIFVRNLMLMFIGFLISIIIARSLGPTLQGKYAIFILIPTLFYNIGNLGIGSSAIYLLNRDYKNRYSYILLIKKIIYILTIFNTILGSIFLYIYVNYANIDVSINEFLMIVLLIPVLLVNNIILFLFQALRNFSQFSFNSLLPKILQLLFLVLFIIIDKNTLFLTLLIFLVSNLLSTIYSIYKLEKIISKVEKNITPISVKEFIMYGLKTHLANTVTFLNYRLDQLLIGLLINSYSVGIYNISVLIVEKIWSLTNPLITVLFPEMSRLEDINKKVELTNKLSRIIVISNFFIGILFFIIMRPFIIITFGKEYIEAVNVTNILLIGILAMNIDKILSNFFASVGHPEINMKITNYTLISNLILALIFIPKFGIMGAALSTTMSYLITFVLKVKRYKIYNDVSYKDILFIKGQDIKYIKSILNR